MGRKKSVETSKIIELIDQLKLQSGGKKIKAQDVALYGKTLGINFNAYVLKRDPVANEYLQRANDNSLESHKKRLVAYVPLDVEEFIARNRGDNLKAALTKLDNYYSSVAKSAVELNKDSRKLEDENRRLKAQIEELKKGQTVDENNAKLLKKYKKIIGDLKDIILDVVYPDIAMQVLNEKGVFEVFDGVVDGNNIKTINASTKVNGFTNDLVRNLVEDLDD